MTYWKARKLSNTTRVISKGLRSQLKRLSLPMMGNLGFNKDKNYNGIHKFTMIFFKLIDHLQGMTGNQQIILKTGK